MNKSKIFWITVLRKNHKPNNAKVEFRLPNYVFFKLKMLNVFTLILLYTNDWTTYPSIFYSLCTLQWKFGCSLHKLQPPDITIKRKRTNSIELSATWKMFSEKKQWVVWALNCKCHCYGCMHHTIWVLFYYLLVRDHNWFLQVSYIQVPMSD